MKEIICKCGNDKFHVGTYKDLTKQFAMCSVCKAIYNDKGEEIEIKKLEGHKVYLVPLK
jgi:hypothetical protein